MESTKAHIILPSDRLAALVLAFAVLIAVIILKTDTKIVEFLPVFPPSGSAGGDSLAARVEELENE